MKNKWKRGSRPYRHFMKPNRFNKENLKDTSIELRNAFHALEKDGVVNITISSEHMTIEVATKDQFDKVTVKAEKVYTETLASYPDMTFHCGNLTGAIMAVFIEHKKEGATG